MILVHCAHVPASLPPDTVARWVGALPASRRPIVARRLAGGRGIESLTGLALLASLSSICGLPPLDGLQWSARGKPEFPRGLNFSVTHAGGYAACAVALDGSTIGIDVEEVERARVAAVRLIANEDEQRALSDGSASPAEFWTAKEAVIKAAGAALPDIGSVLLLRGTAQFAGVDYFIHHRSLGRGLVLSVATPNDAAALTIRWPPFDQLFG